MKRLKINNIDILHNETIILEKVQYNVIFSNIFESIQF